MRYPAAGAIALSGLPWLSRRAHAGRGRVQCNRPGEARNMKIGIVGLGYVGLPLAVAFAEAGHDVAGLDLDSRKIEAIAAGKSYIEDISSERLQAVGVRLSASTRYADLSK